MSTAIISQSHYGGDICKAAQLVIDDKRSCFPRIPEFVNRRFTGFTEFVNQRQLDVLITGMRFTQQARFWR